MSQFQNVLVNTILASKTEKCSLKIAPFDEIDLGRAMLKLVKDASLRRKKGKEGKEFVKKYTWENVASDYTNVIQEVLSTNKTPAII